MLGVTVLSHIEVYLVRADSLLGNIIESANDCDADNIFSLYEMNASEINFIKSMAWQSGEPVFATKTLDGDAILFVRQSRSAFVLCAFVLKIAQIKSLIDKGANVSMSPTLLRYVRKCQSGNDEGVSEVLCAMGLIFDSQNLDMEYLERGIIGYSSVYNCNIQVSHSRADIYLGKEAILSREFLNIFLQSICISSAKHKISNMLFDIEDRGEIFSLCVSATGCQIEDTKKTLGFLSELADMLCVSFTYEYTNGGVNIHVCPYFVDEGLLGVKSRIIFNS